MKSQLPEPAFLTVPEAARICGVSRNTVYSWVRKGKLGAYQTPGRTNLIRPLDLVKFMHANGMFVPSALIELADQDERATAAGAKFAPYEGAENSVLVIDSDGRSRMLAARAVEGELVVDQAETGYEALHILTFRSDIKTVVFDLDAPGHRGNETLCEINRLRPDVAVVVADGKDSKVSRGLLPERMVIETVTKPITVEALKAAFMRVKSDRGEGQRPSTSSG